LMTSTRNATTPRCKARLSPSATKHGSAVEMALDVAHPTDRLGGERPWGVLTAELVRFVLSCHALSPPSATSANQVTSAQFSAYAARTLEDSRQVRPIPPARNAADAARARAAYGPAGARLGPAVHIPRYVPSLVDVIEQQDRGAARHAPHRPPREPGCPDRARPPHASGWPRARAASRFPLWRSRTTSRVTPVRSGIRRT
jgi:hypothetical protein